MKIIVQENYIIPQSQEGKKYADDLGGYLLTKGLFKERTADNVHIYVTAEVTLDIAEGKKYADDLIIRQQAIDEINKLEYPSSLVDVKRIIVELPSAQLEVKRCKDCKYNPRNPRSYYDNDEIYSYAMCGHLNGGEDGFCSNYKPFGERKTDHE